MRPTFAVIALWTVLSVAGNGSAERYRTPAYSPGEVYELDFGQIVILDVQPHDKYHYTYWVAIVGPCMEPGGVSFDVPEEVVQKAVVKLISDNENVDAWTVDHKQQGIRTSINARELLCDGIQWDEK